MESETPVMLRFNITVPYLPMPAGFPFHWSGRRSGGVGSDDASGCEGPGTIASSVPVPHPTGTPQETLD